MTEIKHLRCDRCGDNMTVDRSLMLSETARLWTHCTVNLNDYDFCPRCWKEILKLANVDPAQ